jgi:flagellar biosynthesis chaperone FliJ
MTTTLLALSATAHLLLPVSMGKVLCQQLQAGHSMDAAIERTVQAHSQQIGQLDPSLAHHIGALAIDSSVEQCPATWQRLRRQHQNTLTL